MADDDHSLLLLDFLDTIQICNNCVVLERVHPFEELNEKKFCGRFRLSKHAILHILSGAQKMTQSTNNCS